MLMLMWVNRNTYLLLVCANWYIYCGNQCGGSSTDLAYAAGIYIGAGAVTQALVTAWQALDNGAISSAFQCCFSLHFPKD